jgi:hypothetical protein
MNAFTFRLEQALRWRATQVNLGKTRAAAAAGRVAGIAAEIEARKSELLTAATRILDSPTGGALESYARFKEKSHARIRDLEGQALLAQRALTLEMNRLMEANQKLRLIENLKRATQARWRKEFDRELADFADEAFLIGYNRKTGARSSGG